MYTVELYLRVRLTDKKIESGVASVPRNSSKRKASADDAMLTEDKVKTALKAWLEKSCTNI